ncbi:unnamed protein product, partial [Musa textilis]
RATRGIDFTVLTFDWLLCDASQDFPSPLLCCAVLEELPLHGHPRIKQWAWTRLWLIILINSRNSFGVGPRDQRLLLHVTPGRDKKWDSKPSLGMSWTNGHLGLYVWSKRKLYRRST